MSLCTKEMVLFSFIYINGAGKRPLTHRPPISDIEISICLPNAKYAKGLIADKGIKFVTDGKRVKFKLDRLDDWEYIKISIDIE